MSAKRPYIPAAAGRLPGLPARHRDLRTELKYWWREIDRTLLFLVIVLMVGGSISVAVASPASARRLSTHNVQLPELYFWMAHLRWQFLGLIVMIGTSFLSRELARRAGILLGLVMMGALLLVPLIGHEVNGATRWINLGFTFQPSEFLKPAFAIVLAWILSFYRHDSHLPVFGITAIVVGLVALLLMLQPDFGSTVLFAGVWFVMVLLAGQLPVKRLSLLAGSVFAGLVAIYFFYANARHRIDAFFGEGTAFDQVDLASRTLTAGGWTGSGMWLGTRKMSLPEAHTDYIFSVIGEEFGLIGCAIIVILFMAIIVSTLRRLLEEEDLFAILAGSGLIALFGGQAFINILVNLQLFPSKGMTLPLVSYGGSSTIALCMTIGFLLAITKRNPFLQRKKLPFYMALGLDMGPNPGFHTGQTLIRKQQL